MCAVRRRLAGEGGGGGCATGSRAAPATGSRAAPPASSRRGAAGGPATSLWVGRGTGARQRHRLGRRGKGEEGG